jgi:hypothetical protein
LVGSGNARGAELVDGCSAAAAGILQHAIVDKTFHFHKIEMRLVVKGGALYYFMVHFAE